MKQTIKSVAVLAVITFVCIAVLAIANTYLAKEVVLDFATCSVLNEMCPSGEDDAKAYDENYFVMLTDNELSDAADGFKLSDYKKSATTLVQAIYYARKGASEGAFIVETRSVGQYDMVLLVAFEVKNGDYAISNVKAKDQKEDSNFKQVFNAEYFAKFVDYVKNTKNPITKDEINAITGATTENSSGGLAAGLERAIAAMDGLYSYADEVKTEVEKRFEEVSNE